MQTHKILITLLIEKLQFISSIFKQYRDFPTLNADAELNLVIAHTNPANNNDPKYDLKK